MSLLLQQEFDKRYITTSEIVETLGISRSTVHVARVSGKLPDPIDVHGQVFIWERARVQEYLDAWKLMLDTRRGAVPA